MLIVNNLINRYHKSNNCCTIVTTYKCKYINSKIYLFTINLCTNHIIYSILVILYYNYHWNRSKNKKIKIRQNDQ